MNFIFTGDQLENKLKSNLKNIVKSSDDTNFLKFLIQRIGGMLFGLRQKISLKCVSALLCALQQYSHNVRISDNI